MRYLTRKKNTKINQMTLQSNDFYHHSRLHVSPENSGAADALMRAIHISLIFLFFFILLIKLPHHPWTQMIIAKTNPFEITKKIPYNHVLRILILKNIRSLHHA
jgi:hypothetical protein